VSQDGQPIPPPDPAPPASVQEKLRQGLAMHQHGRLVEAEHCYEEVLRAAPKHFDALHLLGVLALQTGRPERGVGLIAKAIEINPNVAGVHSNLANGLKDLNRLDEALASYGSAIALKPDYAEAYNNRGITLQALNRLDTALADYEKAIALKPDYAEAYNNRGVVLQAQNRSDEALASFDKAIAFRPNYPEAFNNRGNALKDLKRFDRALASYDTATMLRPGYAEAYNNRGLALQDLKHFDAARASFDKAVALKPDYAEAYNMRGMLLQETARFDAALASFDKAIALKPDYAEAYTNQGLCLLRTGHLEQGWRRFEWRKKLQDAFGARSFSQPLWLGEKDISNKILFVHWEQGLGDTLQFYRYGKLLKARGIKVAMSVQEPLFPLLKQADPDIRLINQDEVPAEFDYHCPLLSLPLALQTTLETIPSQERYIFADQQRRREWDNRLPLRTKPRIGIAWSGGIKHKNDHNRSIDLAAIAPLLSADAHWVSLQKELRDGEAARLAQIQKITSYHAELKDFSDTAAVIDLLDLVITVDTSIAHLAGAMGKPVWILLPYNSDWRWLLDRDDSPWYPTARLFRQDITRSWKSVMTRVQVALNDVVGTSSQT
jgi:tetratricopeptide (TPR) repeat protein